MNTILEFISNYYYIFIIIGVFLIFALIGYLVDSKNIELQKPKTVKVDIDTKGDVVEEVETLEQEATSNEEPQPIQEVTNNEVTQPAQEESQPIQEVTNNEAVQPVQEVATEEPSKEQ